jgi:hypothetical protein
MVPPQELRQPLKAEKRSRRQRVCWQMYWYCQQQDLAFQQLEAR